MAIATKTAAELEGELLALQNARNPGITPAVGTDTHQRIKYLVDAVNGIDFNVAEVQKDIFPSTASESGLELHAETRGLQRRPAAAATGTDAVEVYGTAGSLVAIGTALIHADGTRYATTTAGEIPASAPFEDTVSVEATTTGTVGNKGTADTPLNFESAPTGIETEAAIVSSITGGRGEETNAELLERTLHAIQNPPAGGRASDYWQWALEIPGVAAAYIYCPNSNDADGRRGIGVVDVAIVGYGTSIERVTGMDTTVELVEDNIEDNRPCTTKDVAVYVPGDVPQAVDVSLVPETGYEFDYDDPGAIPTATVWVEATLTLTFSGGSLPTGLAVGDRIVCNGEVKVITAAGVADGLGAAEVQVTGLTDYEEFETAAFASSPVGEDIFAGGPLSAPAILAIRDYFDALGPARGTAADPEQFWEDSVKIAKLYSVVQDVPGVYDSTIVTPVANLPGTDPGDPSPPNMFRYGIIDVYKE